MALPCLAVGLSVPAVAGAPSSPLTPAQVRTRELAPPPLKPATEPASALDSVNDQAQLCVDVNTAAFIPNYVGAIFSPAPLDYAFSLAAYAANLSLKFCPAVLNAPPDVAKYPDQEGGCAADFYQSLTEDVFKDVRGLSVFHINWGEIGTPHVYHYNSHVEISMSGLGESLGGGYYRFGVGEHDIDWDAETLLGPLDLAFIYVPHVPWIKEEINVAVELGLVAADFVVEGSPHGVSNEQHQKLTVWDTVPPTIQTSEPVVQVEANDPGGAHSRDYVTALEATLTTHDKCDRPVDVTSQGIAPFWPVNTDNVITWVARDPGPNPSGGRNSATVTQTVQVRDTRPPLLLAPPSKVVESDQIPAAVDLGGPQVFDVVDLDPSVSNDAPGQFPLGKTTVTWTATDESGNSAQASQLVNVKIPGTNHTPVADDQRGSHGSPAISYSPTTITLHGEDADLDPLSFTVKQRPANGFFVAPLYPYFIGDYRIENNYSQDDLKAYCDRREQPPRDFVTRPVYVTVDDKGNTYVVDEYYYCQPSDLVTYPRIAKFGPSGELVGMQDLNGAGNVTSIFITPTGLVTYVTPPSEGMVVMDNDLNELEFVRLDGPTNGLPQLYHYVDAVIDHQGVIYATDGVKIYAYDLSRIDQNNDPAFLGAITPNGFFGAAHDMAVDSQDNLFVSDSDQDRIYKFSASTLYSDGSFVPGALVGWVGKCDSGAACDVANHRSIGYSCTDDTCSVVEANGSNCGPYISGPCTPGPGPGQFDEPRGIAIDPHDTLYVTDYNNLRVQRLTPEGYFAGQAHSTCDGTCFVLGDFGRPLDVSVNSDHFYVLNRDQDLLYIFQTSVVTPIDDASASVVYQSNNNFVGTDSFTFQASDGLADSNVASVDVHVTRNHRPPHCIDGLSATTPEDTPVAVTLSGADPDGALDTLSFSAVTQPRHGTLSGQGANLLYTPNHNYNGPDAFSFVTSDGEFTSAPSTFTLNVTPVNDPPVVTAPASLAAGEGYRLLFNADFTDPDAGDRHTTSIDWGDGTVEPEGVVQSDGTMSGPILAENGDGTGTVRGSHVYLGSGTFTLQTCVTDNVTGDAPDKNPTASSLTACSSTPVTVSPMADMSIDLVASANPLVTGQALEYTATATNLAPEAGSGVTATHVILTNRLPRGVSLASAQSSQGSCSGAGRDVTCNLGSVSPGANASVRLGVTLTSSAGSILTDFAKVTADQPDAVENNQAVQITDVVAPSSFVATSADDQPDASPGDGQCASSSGACTLRAAIQESNASPGLQTIALTGQTYTLTLTGTGEDAAATGDLDITDNVVITGLSAKDSVINAAGIDRVFDVHGGVSVTISDVAITGGKATGNGGGLRNDGGTVTLSGVDLRQNSAAAGGGVASLEGKLSIDASALADNTASADGGGVANGGELEIINTTLAGNHAGGSGGGVFDAGTTTLGNVTVAGNSAHSSGGGLAAAGGTLAVSDAIVAGNGAPSGNDCSGLLSSGGHNLIQDGAGCTLMGDTTGNLEDRDPMLGPLEDNGGGTPTLALRPGSPAIDAGSCAVEVDQRGVRRPQGGACDIGAYELRLVRSPRPWIGRPR